MGDLQHYRHADKACINLKNAKVLPLRPDKPYLKLNPGLPQTAEKHASNRAGVAGVRARAFRGWEGDGKGALALPLSAYGIRRGGEWRGKCGGLRPGGVRWVGRWGALFERAGGGFRSGEDVGAEGEDVLAEPVVERQEGFL